MFRHLFSYVPSEQPHDEPEVEPPDPNLDRSLSDAYRSARRTLVAVCAISIAWSTAQFGLGDVNIDAAGITIDVQDASIPVLLGASILYLFGRWMHEFAMMPRTIRRWPLAQLDFRVGSVLARFSVLALAAAAMQRSLWSVVVVVLSLAGVATAATLLMLPLMMLAMFIRMRARERAGAVSAASASAEAFVWGLAFSVGFTIIGTVAFAVASYRYEPLRNWLWPTPPDGFAMATFVVTLIAMVLSNWLLIPVYRKLFAERPSYRTSRDSEGKLTLRFVDHERERLL